MIVVLQINLSILSILKYVFQAIFIYAQIRRIFKNLKLKKKIRFLLLGFPGEKMLTYFCGVSENSKIYI